MEIPRDPNPIDPATRRRAAEARVAKAGGGRPAASAADIGAKPASETLARYVAMLKAHSGDPARLERLRLSLENGTFTATSEELVDPLLSKLDEPGG